MTSLAPPATRSVRLPAPRGPLSAFLIDALLRPPHLLSGPSPAAAEALDDDDLQLSLHCCYELHYRGFEGVDDGWEWEPSLLAWRAELERVFEDQLLTLVPRRPVPADEVVAELWSIATTPAGPSLSAWALDHGTLTHARELAVHRSAYQLKEADPHTWAIPRLTGRAKAAMVTIQADEYGEGAAPAMHASLFADTMDELDLDASYGAYIDELPAATLATDNLVSFLGLHRRLRGALVGHLALFEMTSVGPMGRYASWLERLGIGRRGRAFYDVHVAADAHHQHIAADDMVGGLLADEPDLAADIVWGALVLGAVEGRFTQWVLDHWDAGCSSLAWPNGGTGTSPRAPRE